MLAVGVTSACLVGGEWWASAVVAMLEYAVHNIPPAAQAQVRGW
jgi:hypothetical protein